MITNKLFKIKAEIHLNFLMAVELYLSQQDIDRVLIL